MGNRKKHEALTVTRLINEILVGQLGIPLSQIVNDTTFQKYTGSKRPDLLISEVEYDTKKNNEQEYIENLVAYAEVKDNCIVDDSSWREAKRHGKKKAKGLKLPYFIVTNCATTIFYNVASGKEIRLNSNPIREFQTIDIFRLIKNKLLKEPKLFNILTNVDSISVISEAIFNKKLWEMEMVYRNIKFENRSQRIDFTIGFISLEFFEEKEEKAGIKNASKLNWSTCGEGIGSHSDETLVANLAGYIHRLKAETQFSEFSDFINKVQVLIVGIGSDKAVVDRSDVRRIYNIINSMRPLHGCGFDLFGAVYEMMADSKEKKEFGEFFTRRHYAHILAKLLLRNEKHFDKERKFRILDPACGTGGFLTESFKILHTEYLKNGCLTKRGIKFLEEECFYGFDAKKDNISRTKLNMFLVGDGHTNMQQRDSLRDDWGEEQWDYIITNPPYGAGTIKAETPAVSSRRTEIAFLCKIIKHLKNGGAACVILPDGVLENPSLSKLRNELLEKCLIIAIISLPKFAFAPYTKEKTYAVFFSKKSKKTTRIQKEPIWMYIIDNDGLANSDKRFPTKLRKNNNGWMHDEILGWVSVDGEEQHGLLEERFIKFDDTSSGGTEWIDEKGATVKLRKGGEVKISNVLEPRANYCLLPEYYLRQLEPHYLTPSQLKDEILAIENEIKGLLA